MYIYQKFLVMPKYYAKPEHSRNEVNRAGEILLNPNATKEQLEHALLVVNNWRSAHNFPLNTFQVRLRKIAKEINPNCLVAQRIKRLTSIKAKLQDRFTSMRLVQMQDIGGCRAIMSDVSEVDSIVDIYKHKSRGMLHELAGEDNYIQSPQATGYRSVHLIYKYKSRTIEDYKNMRIEIQIRTELQHAWATAVETAGTFRDEPLKAGGGDADWLRFFVVFSSALAILEDKPVVPGTSESYIVLRDEIKYLADKLKVVEHLLAFRDSMETISIGRRGGSYYYLLDLDAEARKVTIKSYNKTQLEVASADYLTLEKRIDAKRNAVLVSADSVESLKAAFPNYYLDTHFFISILNIVLGIENPSDYKRVELVLE